MDPVRRLVSDFVAFERLLRATLAAGGRVVTSAAEAHASENLGGLAGHQVFAAVTTANGDVSSAIAALAGGHRQLESLGRKLGYDVLAYGDGKKPPEETKRLLMEYEGLDGAGKA